MSFDKAFFISKIKIITFSLVLAFVFSAQSSVADAKTSKAPGGYIFPGEIYSTIGTGTEYSFRGISRTDKKPTLNASLDWEINDNFYAGLWVSNADFGDQDDASTEVDYYGGYKFSVGEKTNFDVGIKAYTFPSTDTRLEYRFFDYYVGASHDFNYFITSLKFFYSSSYQFDSGDGFYTDFNVEMPVYRDLYFKGHYGYLTVADETRYAYGDYGDWEVGFGYRDLYGFDLDVTYLDTDLPEEGCYELCDNRMKATLSYKIQLY